MITVRIQDGKAVEALTEFPRQWEPCFENRNDWRTFERAAEVAAQLTEATGVQYLATNNPSCRPQFDVIRAPAVGDVVSRGFNGDYYPVGTVVKVGKGHKTVTTSDGSKFWRRRETGSWLETGGGFALVQGHHDKRNPHF